MPSITSAIAVGLSLLIAVPVLALGAGGDTCPAGTSPQTPLTPGPASGTASELPRSSRPRAPGTATTRDAEQLHVAATIITVGRAKHVPAWGQVIATATALQESGLRNLPGGDLDSIGVFQQRPSAGWGTPAQLRSVDYQAGRFYDALLAVPNWQALPLTVAAQTIQRSAHPQAYAAWADEATALVAQLSEQDSLSGHDTALLLGAGGCPGGSADGGPTGSPLTLPAGFSLPAGTPAQVATAISWALAQQGTPYSYGGDCTAPRSGDPARACDCSSLVQKAYAAASVTMPRTTTQQVRVGAAVSDLAHLQPGDLVFIPGSDGTQRPGHVALYIGDGLAVHAPRQGDVVRLVDIAVWRPMVAAIRRPVP